MRNETRQIRITACWAIGIFFLLLKMIFPASAQENTYVGAERCRSCHVKAYDIWMNSAHARAQNSLPEEKKKELRCLFCHATDAQANLTLYKLVNVQCEACHGPGAKHVSLAIKRTDKGKVGGLDEASEQRCKNCHADTRSPLIRPFRYDAALQKIRHW